MAETIREIIAEQIKTDNPTFVVKAFAASKPEIEKPTVYVYREAVTSIPEKAAIGHEIKVALMVPGLPSEASENALDELLAGVLTSLNRFKLGQWSRAERTVFYDTYSGYEITVTAHTSNIFKPSA
ncbi:hypothetical protein ARZXY2_1477 [Arthrobacter sp. ZXY-2]|nr:hypothetical protein ARZXY2_1477 [Arthrobacter sp. ZXY-2]